MTDTRQLSPWIRRFLLEYLISARNLSVNTQKSYRDMLRLLLPFASATGGKAIDNSSWKIFLKAACATFCVLLEINGNAAHQRVINGWPASALWPGLLPCTHQNTLTGMGG